MNQHTHVRLYVNPGDVILSVDIDTCLPGNVLQGDYIDGTGPLHGIQDAIALILESFAIHIL